MAYELNKKLKGLVPYEPISGSYDVRLDANESFIQPGEELRKKIFEAIAGVQLNRYPDALCTGVRRAFAQAYGINSEVVAAGNGSDELISIIISSFLEKGDRVITLNPDFSMYGFYCGCAECENVVIGKNGEFEIDVDAIIDAVNENKAKMVIFSNPCNPTSVGASAEEMRRLVSSTDALVIIDEAYMDFWDESLIAETENYSNLIVLKTCSKAIGFAAIRLGFAVSNRVITNAINAAKSPYNVNSVTQAIGEVVLSDREYLKSCADKIKLSKNELYDILACYNSDDFKVIDGRTNFVYVKTKRAKYFYEKLRKQSIIVRCFDGALRITAGNDFENCRLKDALHNIFCEDEKI